MKQLPMRARVPTVSVKAGLRARPAVNALREHRAERGLRSNGTGETGESFLIPNF